jgi:predicted RNA methylase
MRSLGTLLHRLRFRRAIAREREFDIRYGVDTGGVLLEPRMEGRSAETRNWANPYYGTPGSAFRRIIRRSGIRPRDFIFVDLGCGKGRTLLLASLFGFREVIGVEADSHFAGQARLNAEAWLRQHLCCRPIRIIEADARDFDAPDEDLFIYMYNPFKGQVFECVADQLAALARQAGRRVVIAYVTDLYGDYLENTGAFARRRLRPLRFWARPTVSYFVGKPTAETLGTPRT